MNLLRKMWTNDDGQDLVEYVMVAGLVALGIGAALTAFKGTLSTAWSTIGSTLTSATTP